VLRAWQDLNVYSDPEGWNDPTLTSDGPLNVVTFTSSDLSSVSPAFLEIFPSSGCWGLLFQNVERRPPKYQRTYQLIPPPQWTGPTLVTVGGKGCVWAPDAIWDTSKNEYLMYYTGGVSGFGTDKTYTTSFQSYSAAPVGDSNMSGMDQAMKLDPSTGIYYLVAKSSSTGYIQLSQSTAPDGTFTLVKDGIGQGTVPSAEGPYLFPDNSVAGKVSLIFGEANSMVLRLTAIVAFVDG